MFTKLYVRFLHVHVCQNFIIFTICLMVNMSVISCIADVEF